MTGTDGSRKQPPDRGRRVCNEAWRLYELNVDQVFSRTGHVAMDSSLGVSGAVPAAPSGERKP
jgi:hypothetical protein